MSDLGATATRPVILKFQPRLLAWPCLDTSNTLRKLHMLGKSIM